MFFYLLLKKGGISKTIPSVIYEEISEDASNGTTEAKNIGTLQESLRKYLEEFLKELLEEFLNQSLKDFQRNI